jgi:uncharacterized protein (DUF1501 family)
MTNQELIKSQELLQNQDHIKRRDFLKWGIAGMVLTQMPSLLAAESNAPAKKFIWIVLRGAMDSLHAVVPSFDPDLKILRAPLVNAIENNLQPMASGYGLHPAFKHLHAWYREGSFAPVVAVASPYRERSHFDAQDILEAGQMPVTHENGWLARALHAYRGDAVAIARSVPISLRGNSKALTWYPSNLPDAEGDLYERLMQLYEYDQSLHQRLQEGIHTRNNLSMSGENVNKPKFANLAESCGKLLAGSAQTHCAMLEMGGWDTHNAQAQRLDTQFKELDAGLAALRAALGEDWKNTAIVIATEFGRTAAVNGTNGTDHGTASALFLAGGAIAGGKVLGEWPGLAKAQLYEGRDLRPTSDMRSWVSTVLNQHWGLSAKQLHTIFPKVNMAPHQLIRA